MLHLAAQEEIDFDPTLIMPFSCLTVGPSGCGRTYFVNSVLENYQHVMNAVPNNVVWIYTSFEPMYAELQKMNKINKICHGIV